MADNIFREDNTGAFNRQETGGGGGAGSGPNNSGPNSGGPNSGGPNNSGPNSGGPNSGGPNSSDPNNSGGNKNGGAGNKARFARGAGIRSGGLKNSKKGSGHTGMAKWVVLLVIVLLIAACGNNCFYRVDEQESAVVTMFGNVLRTDTAGLYFKLPFIQQIHKVDTTIHGTGIGYVVDNDGQSFTVDTEGIMITSDFNLIDIDFYMEYRVSDPVAYLYNSRNPETILKNIAMAAIRSTVIDYTVDDAMTTGKSQIQAEVKAKMQETLTEQNVGLQIVNITVQDAEPPTAEIVSAFKAVETAKQGKDTAINNANKYQNEQIPAAEAAADKIIQNATAEKTARIAEAEGQVARFNAMYEQYRLNPLITKQRMFYETIEEVLPDAKVIFDDSNTQTVYPLESFAGTVSGKEEDAS